MKRTRMQLRRERLAEIITISGICAVLLVVFLLGMGVERALMCATW